MTNDVSHAVRSVYVHVPFCRHHCGYCNFSVIADRNDLIDEFLWAIEKEIEQSVAAASPTSELETLYFGGGTPTQLSCDQFRRLFDAVTRHYPLAANCEVTVEANPADVEPEKINTFAELGVSRVSLGVQSFHDDHLVTLERDHSGQRAESAVELMRSLGINSLNVDLMFAVPGQSMTEWRDDLRRAVRLTPDHLSTYGLTFEKGTPFFSRLRRGELSQAEEDLERDMYLAAIDMLPRAGFEHYEVSNFALPDKRSRHNEIYWTGKPYLAFGPGAARFVDGRRETNHRSVTTYLRRIREAQSPVAESEQLDPEDAARERLVFGLRRLEGISPREFQRDTGFSVEELVGEQLMSLIAMGLLESTPETLRLTQEGLLVSDNIWPHFL